MLNEAPPLNGAATSEVTGWSAIDAVEIGSVERMMELAGRHGVRGLATAATRVGNGWLYLVLSLSLIPSRSERVLQCAATAAISIAAAFAIYPLLKRCGRRLRPYELRPALRSDVRALDRYSFPSGHAMTAAACGVPFLFTYALSAAFIVIPVWAVISWSRMALGHHYPSDVVAGTLLGASIACSVAMFIG